MPRMLLGLVLLAGCAAHHGTQTNAAERVPNKVPDVFVQVEDGKFVLHGQPVRFFGVNIYSFASQPLPKYHCGRVYQDAEVFQALEEIKSLVPPPFVPAIRMMMFQNYVGLERDWSRYDLIFAEARRLGIKVIPYLDCHWGSCFDGIHRSPDWYRQGYRRAPGDGTLSQRDFVREAAMRYRHEPALLMWQVINEGQCRDAQALYAYAADLSGLLKELDPNHLVSFGTLGDDWDRYGAQGEDYVMLHRLPTIDVVESHDHWNDVRSKDRPWRSEPITNCVQTAKLTGKPCMIGELGMVATTPEQKAARAAAFAERVRMFFQSGAQMVLIWSYRAGDKERDFDPTDPMYEALRKALLD